MKHSLKIIGALFAMTASALAGSRFAILPLDNKANLRGETERSAFASDSDHLDRCSLVIRDEIETWLSQQPGVKVMERKDLDKILKELDLHNASGLIDDNTAVPYGSFKGASHLVGGTILKISRKATTFKGYGITAQRETYTLRFRLKIMDAATAEMAYSGNYSVAIPVQQTNTASSENSDMFDDLAEKVGEQLDGDEKLKAFLGTLAKPEKKVKRKVDDSEASSDEAPASAVVAEKVEIKIAPSPENCDVQVGGVSVGTSPVKVQLPEGKQVVVRITKQGYLPWQQRVLVSKDLKLAPELTKPKPPANPTIIVVPKRD